MWTRVRIAIAAVFGAFLGLAASLEPRDLPRHPIASVSPTAETARADMVFGLTFSRAQARGTKKTRRRAEHEAEARAAEEERLKEEREKKFKGVRLDTLPAECAYDANASAFNSADIYTCGGLYYQRYEENGKTYYEGHPVGLDRKELQKERAQEKAAEKKRKAAADKKKQAGRRAELPKDCGYDSYASTSRGEDIYLCRGVYYRQYEDKGVTGYEVVKP